jgi:hypothetical protein
MAGTPDPQNPSVEPEVTPEQLEFPDPEEFVSYDEVDSENGQAELPVDSFEFNTADFDTEGCGCVR